MLVAVAASAFGEAAVAVVRDVRLLAAPGEAVDQTVARARDAAVEGALDKAVSIVLPRLRGIAGAETLSRAEVAALVGRLFEPGIVASEPFAAQGGQGVFVKAQVSVDVAVFAAYARDVLYNRSLGKPDPQPARQRAQAMDALDAALPAPWADMAVPDVSVSKGRLADPWLAAAAAATGLKGVANAIGLEGVANATRPEGAANATAPVAQTGVAAAPQTATDGAANASTVSTQSSNGTQAAMPAAPVPAAPEPFSLDTAGGTAADLLAQGRALARRGQWQDAARLYDMALATAPDDAAALASRGYAYDVLGKPARMCADFDRACVLGLCAPLREAQRLDLCAAPTASAPPATSPAASPAAPSAAP
ncbi:MAG: hypothetical protein AB7E47_05390 [Desulfovibrionaceae bacterium]